MFTSPYPLELAPEERAELEAMSRSRTLAAGLAQRARIILAIAAGEPYAVLRARLEVSTTTLTRWRKRFEHRRVAGLHDALRSGRGDRLSPAFEAKVLALTQKPPPKPLTHWTTRRLAGRLGISHMTVARVWKRAGLKPHRLEHYVASPDPDFEQKAADIIGLYLNPPAHAVVLCVDEKTAMPKTSPDSGERFHEQKEAQTVLVEVDRRTRLPGPRIRGEARWHNHAVGLRQRKGGSQKPGAPRQTVGHSARLRAASRAVRERDSH